MRRAARKDGNHNDIVGALERIGCSVLDLSKLGDGVPDPDPLWFQHSEPRRRAA